MAVSNIVSRLKRNGWKEGYRQGQHIHLVHPEQSGFVTFPAQETSAGRLAGYSPPNPALAILSRRKADMPCYYAAFLPEKDGYSVLFPDIPGCQTCGKSLEEAFAMAVDALSGHLEALNIAGEAQPESSSPEVAHERLQSMCAEYGIPIPENHALLLQMIPALEQDASLIRVSVSFRKSTLAMIDRKAEAEGMTRSGFLAAAAAGYAVSPRE